MEHCKQITLIYRTVMYGALQADHFNIQDGNVWSTASIIVTSNQATIVLVYHMYNKMFKHKGGL